MCPAGGGWGKWVCCGVERRRDLCCEYMITDRRVLYSDRSDMCHDYSDMNHIMTIMTCFLMTSVTCHIMAIWHVSKWQQSHVSCNAHSDICHNDYSDMYYIMTTLTCIINDPCDMRLNEHGDICHIMTTVTWVRMSTVTYHIYIT